MIDMPPLEHLQLSALNADKVLRLVQITDCHLGEQSGERLVGMDTDSSLDHVLTLIQKEQVAAHLLLATGDLANHGSAEAYLRLKSKLASLGLPNAWLAGNHDGRDLMVNTVGSRLLPRTVRAGRWLIVMMDSAVPGQVGGELGEQELGYLAQALSAHADADYVIACLHHQPIPIGCDWLDEQRLADSDKLLAILSQEPRLRAVLWGHVHQAFNGHDARLPNVQLLSAPSTCVQFAPNSEGFKLDQIAPGYRWLDLYPDGHLETAVSRLDGIDLAVDYASQGYK
jgi:Icc protein